MTCFFMCSNPNRRRLNEMREVASATPALSGRSLQVAQAAEALALKSEPIDTASAWDRFNELLAIRSEAVA